MRKQIGSFIAKDAGGNPVTIYIYQDFTTSRPALDGSSHVIPGVPGMATAAGHNVNRQAKGKYQVVQTGQTLTSDDPNAP